MRRVLIALLVLTAPLAGCLDTDEVQIDGLDIPRGTLATYEITANGTTTEDTYVAMPRSAGGVDLWPHNVSRETFGSPFLRLGESLTPRAFNWSGVFDFPLTPGKSYEGQVGGADATVTLERAQAQGPQGTQDAIQAIATADGSQIARFTVLSEPTLLAAIHVDTPDGTQQNWTLTQVRHAPGWNDAPDWRIGDWWTYNATTRDRHAQPTLIYNANDTSNKGSPQRVLNPQTVDSRLASLPFLVFRDHDIAPQSGLLSGLLSSFWKWPLFDGQTWTGTTNVGGLDAYRADVTRETRVEVPGERYTTAFRIEARSANDPSAPPFAEWRYAPLVGMITQIEVRDARTNETDLDWELLDFGHGFHGEIEIPQRVGVYGREGTSGPASIEESFSVPEQATRLQVRGTAVRQEGASKNLTLELTTPGGEQAWLKNGSEFRERLLQFDDVVDAENGTWTFNADLPPGVNFFIQIRGAWIEHRQVDYR